MGFIPFHFSNRPPTVPGGSVDLVPGSGFVGSHVFPSKKHRQGSEGQLPDRFQEVLAVYECSPKQPGPPLFSCL